MGREIVQDCDCYICAFVSGILSKEVRLKLSICLLYVTMFSWPFELKAVTLQHKIIAWINKEK